LVQLRQDVVARDRPFCTAEVASQRDDPLMDGPLAGMERRMLSKGRHGAVTRYAEAIDPVRNGGAAQATAWCALVCSGEGMRITDGISPIIPVHQGASGRDTTIRGQP
jgi:hypothetical protein